MKLLYKAKSLLAVLILFLTIFFSCKEEEKPRYTVCGCTGTDLENINNELGVVAKTVKGFKIIGGNRGYITICNDMPDSMKKNGLLIKFSGQSIKTCKDNTEYYPLVFPIIDLTQIDSIPKIEKIGKVKVEVFQFTNQWGFSGFGYKLSDTVRNFVILQDDIPGLDGAEPFQTAEGAWVVAVLTAHKINSNSDFPTFTLADQYFLGYR